MSWLLYRVSNKVYDVNVDYITCLKWMMGIIFIVLAKFKIEDKIFLWWNNCKSVLDLHKHQHSPYPPPLCISGSIGEKDNIVLVTQ